jgi:hypothetical protein
MVAPNIVSIGIVVFFVLFCFVCYVQKWLSVHLHWAEITKQKWGLQVTPEFYVLSIELTSCHHSGTNNLKVTVRFLEQNMEYEPVLQMGADRMIWRYVYHEPFTAKFPDKCE